MCIVMSVKEKVEQKKAELMRLTMEFSNQYLNKEYEQVIGKLINKMGRKREVPFISGRIEIWAAAVIHALGTVNFLFDKESQPYVSVEEILEFFGTKQSTTSQKSKKIRDMFKMNYFDSEFSIESVSQESPFNSMTMINGMMVPVSMVTEEQGVVEEWEVEVAQILGETKLEQGKTYNGQDLYDILKVTDKRLLRFGQFLNKQLSFPFPASFQAEVDMFLVADYDVSCISFDQEMKVDDKFGLLVQCKYERDTISVPLTIIELVEDNINFDWIELYKTWFWNYR